MRGQMLLDGKQGKDKKNWSSGGNTLTFLFSYFFFFCCS